MSSAVASIISEEQKRQYREEGYFLLERVMPQEHLEMLRDECQRFIDLEDSRMDEAKTDVLGINHRNKRYFVAGACAISQRIPEFVYSELTAELCRATLGSDSYLFWDQYVVKGAEVGMKFGWHQDSGYVGHPHRPYLTLWCALDDMSVENGTVYILPYSRAGSRDVQPHVQEKGTNDLIGYHGSDPGIPVIVPAGSIAVFSSTTFHRSGANTTNKMRRVYLAQYSGEIIMDKEGKKPQGQHEPFLKNGQRVR
jgi:ectoine hydroxylase-related dioxygenase (phytanoyl-CoA dioxygenase family)